MKKIVVFLVAAVLCCACKAKVELPEILRQEAFPGLDTEQLAAQYVANKAEWDAACAFLSRTDLDTLSCGEYPLTEGGTYAFVQEYDLDPVKAHNYERHQKHVDIQYVIGGEETIYICKVEDLRGPLEEYSEERDIETFAEAVTQTGYVMNRSCFVIVFPSDPHMPGCVPPSGAGHVRKVVVKVSI
ncbi:MAG: YhcH/YjgK/YiaL family protein [Bacteroidales bacterium]|nr:YhcH/YjgK/YiaL family protein [Bacteroidales bacterium]